MKKEKSIYKNPRRKPVGDPVTVPIEHRPKTIQETLKEMVEKELRFRARVQASGVEGVEAGLTDNDLLGDEDDIDNVNLTMAERDYLLAELETAARIREKLAQRKQLTGRKPGDQKTLPAQNPDPDPLKKVEGRPPTKEE